jgi:hypothetical protein
MEFLTGTGMSCRHLGLVVARQHRFRSPALGIEAPVAVPAADIENGLAAEIDAVELALDEAPDPPWPATWGVLLTALNPFPKSNS